MAILHESIGKKVWSELQFGFANRADFRAGARVVVVVSLSSSLARFRVLTSDPVSSSVAE